MHNKKHIKYIQHLLSVIMAVLLGYMIWYQYDSIQGEKKEAQFLELTSEAEGGAKETESAMTEAIAGEEETIPQESEPVILSRFENPYGLNPQLAGWIEIPNTKLNLPVMQGDDNQYYLNHDLNGEEDKKGTIFANWNTDLNEKQSNIVLYGHRMRDGSMFGILKHYKEEAYFREHPRICFSTLYEEREYEIIAVFTGRIYAEPSDEFKYYDYKNIQTAQEFEEYYSGSKALSLYETGKSASYGDELLTLCTCDYDEEDGRLLVVAKRIY